MLIYQLARVLHVLVIMMFVQVSDACIWARTWAAKLLSRQSLGSDRWARCGNRLKEHPKSFSSEQVMNLHLSSVRRLESTGTLRTTRFLRDGRT